jgi:Co/Zn/Cd efflux system component
MQARRVVAALAVTLFAAGGELAGARSAGSLADGMVTVAALLGALAIKLFGWWRVDPGLSLAIGVWLTVWVMRLLRDPSR